MAPATAMCDISAQPGPASQLGESGYGQGWHPHQEKALERAEQCDQGRGEERSGKIPSTLS